MSITRGNTSQACAACKYQRRKCSPDCILAPYFPHNRQQQFINAHKLFGVSNITKILRNLDPPEKDEAMRTIIFQSDIRATDPVGGCYRLIRDLQRQIEYNKAELDIVLHQLAMYRTNHHHHHHHNQAVDSALNCGDGVMMTYDHHCYNSNNNNNQVVVPVHDIASWVMHGDDDDKQCFVVDECIDDDEDDDDARTLALDVNGDQRQEIHFEPEEFIQGSEEAEIKDERAILREENESIIQHVEDHDLKSAATFFSLTNSIS